MVSLVTAVQPAPPQVSERILVVDDNLATRQLLGSFLGLEGYPADFAEDGEQAVKMIRASASSPTRAKEGASYALILADLNLGDMSGLDVLSHARELLPDAQRVIITGQADVESAIKALREGAQDYLLKPFHLGELSVTLSRLLENRRKAQESVRLLQEARRRAEHFAVLSSVGHVVTASLDLDEVLSLILSQVKEALRVEAGSIALQEGDCLVFRVSEGPAASEVTSCTLELGQGIIGRCVAQGKSFLVNDVRSDSRHYRGVDERTSFVTKAVLSVPMRTSSGVVIGAIEALNRIDEAGFDDDDLALLEAIAVSAAAAVENARLHHSLEARAEELARALSELEELDRLKSEFVQNVSHELRTPLTFIRGYVELLHNGVLGPLTSEQAESLGVVYEQAESLTRLVNDIVLMQEYQLDQDQVRVFPLASLISEALSQLDGKRDDLARVQLDLGDDERRLVAGNEDFLRRAISNVVENALKFDPDARAVRVTASDAGDHWEITVTDSGVGIPESEQERIFERFYQVDGSATRRFGGTGLGLAVAKEIIVAHGGSIWVESQEGRGSTFGILLAKAVES
jgi:signal transduction histidine kinase/DNA-binding response OmpR family regulator